MPSSARQRPARLATARSSCSPSRTPSASGPRNTATRQCNGDRARGTRRSVDVQFHSMNIWLLAIILGLVEGITEFIPVSFTGHLLLVENQLGVKPDDFFASELFNSFIQVWAMLAALPLFRARLATLAKWRDPKS